MKHIGCLPLGLMVVGIGQAAQLPQKVRKLLHYVGRLSAIIGERSGVFDQHTAGDRTLPLSLGNSAATTGSGDDGGACDNSSGVHPVMGRSFWLPITARKRGAPQ